MVTVLHTDLLQLTMAKRAGPGSTGHPEEAQPRGPAATTTGAAEMEAAAMWVHKAARR